MTISQNWHGSLKNYRYVGDVSIAVMVKVAVVVVMMVVPVVLLLPTWTQHAKSATYMVTPLETVGGGTKMITMVMVVTRVLMWLRMALIRTGTTIQVLQTISQVIEAS